MRGFIALVVLSAAGVGAVVGLGADPEAALRRLGELIHRPQPTPVAVGDAPTVEPPALAAYVSVLPEASPLGRPVAAEPSRVRRAPADVALPLEAPASPPPAAPLPMAPLPPEEPSLPASEPRLVSTGKVTTVYARPSKRARRLGYLRAGAVVSRATEPTTRRGCAGGFYEIAPEGFVCAGETASTDVDHVMVKVASQRADRNAAMPYVYGIAPHAGAPLYTRVPDDAEQKVAEPDLTWHLRHPAGGGFESLHLDAIPWFLEGGQPTISVHGYRLPRSQLVERRALARSGYAFVSLFASGERRFGLTTDMAIVPLDRVERIEGSRFHGAPLDEARGLPMVFARGRKIPVYRGEPKGAGLTFQRFLEFREGVPVTGRTARVGKHVYFESRDGTWVRDRSLVLVEARKELPDAAAAGEKWIDVSIENQVLVAYDGVRPVFVTLVSTGKDGVDDPETTHATVRGEFRIHTKHVSVTMDGDEVGDEFELNDVPYVQYFSQGYALHAAYWHDGFGTPRSHGCVNLSPMDARWLFGWSDPPVPTAWHGAMSVARGTLVSIHP